MTRRLLIAFCVSSLCAALMVTPSRAQDAEPRVALLIANASYPDADAPIPSALADARGLAAEFTRLGFVTEVGTNLGKQEMNRVISAFASKINPGVTALFYFGGIGLQVERQTYLVPVDAQIWSEADAVREGVNLNSLLNDFNRKGAKVKIVLIDAARRNPFERRFRAVPLGLAPLSPPEGTLALFSAAAGAVVRDKQDSGPSLFAAELIKQLQAPSQTVEQTFARTRIGVSTASSGENLPWLTSSLLSEIYLRPPGPAMAKPESAPAPNVQAKAPSAGPSSATSPPGSPTSPPSSPASPPRPSRSPISDAIVASLSNGAPPPAEPVRNLAADYGSLKGYKAFAMVPGTSNAFGAGDHSSQESAREKVLEACELAFRNSCTLVAVNDEVQTRSGDGNWPRQNMPRVRYAGRFDPAQIPAVRSDLVDRADIRGYLSAPAPKAAAIHPTGVLTSISGAANQRDAEERALANCNAETGSKRAEGPCLLYSVANKVVLPTRYTTARPPARTAVEAISLVATNSAVAADYAAAAPNKALAFDPESGLLMRWTGSRFADVGQIALEGCQITYARPCVLIAVNDELRAPDPFSGERQHMERVGYKGPYNPSMMPLRWEKPELINGYLSKKGHKAIAIRAYGTSLYVVFGAPSRPEAERRALAGCSARGPSPYPCLLYAVNGDVVLPQRRSTPTQ